MKAYLMSLEDLQDLRSMVNSESCYTDDEKKHITSEINKLIHKLIGLDFAVNHINSKRKAS